MTSAQAVSASCSYCIDSQDRIVYVNEEWNAFARENCGETVLSERVLETSLWSYITGLETRLLYKLIIDWVRRNQETMTFPIRCDSPTARRRLELRLEPGRFGSCTFTSRVLRETKRPYLSLFDVNHPRTDESLARCGWCMNIHVPSNNWLAPERAAKELALDSQRPLPTLLHTVCPTCTTRIEQICGVG